MPLPSKRFLTIPNAMELLSSAFGEECLAETIWDYIINQQLHICVLKNNGPFNYREEPSVDSQLTIPENDLEELATHDSVCYVNTSEIPVDYQPWFKYQTIMTYPDDENSVCDCNFGETRFCMIDIETAHLYWVEGEASSQVLNYYDMAYITREEIDRFTSCNLETQEESRKIEEPINTQQQRELVLAGWVLGMGERIDPNSLQQTRQELWDELSKANNQLFRPASEDTIKKFVSKQQLVKLNPGRPKGGIN